MRVTRLLLFITVISFLQVLESRRHQAPQVNILPGRLISRMDFLEECKNSSTATTLTSYAIHEGDGGRTWWMEYEVKLSRWIYHLTKAIFIIKNCRDSSEGSCEVFQTWHFNKECCRQLEMKGQPWTTMLEQARPIARCPFAPANYISKNSSLDTKLLSSLPFPLEKYHWRIRMDIYDPERALCVDIGTHFVRSRT